MEMGKRGEVKKYVVYVDFKRKDCTSFSVKSKTPKGAKAMAKKMMKGRAAVDMKFHVKRNYGHD
jgi:hypothetical protein